MSTNNFQGNASSRTFPPEHPPKSVSDGPATGSQANPRTELALTVPAIAAASRSNGDLNGSLPHSHPAGGQQQPPRHHEASAFGGHTTTNMGSMSMAGGGYGSLSLAPHRRKRTDGGTTMTLFVRSKDSALSDGNTVDVSSSGKDNPNGAGRSERAKAAESAAKQEEDKKAESMPLVLVESVASALTSSSEKMVEAIPSIRKALRKPIVTAAVVFLFFLLVDIYTVMQARRTVQHLLDATAATNDQLLTVSAGLSEQYAVKQEYADALAEPYRRTPPADVERAKAEAHALAKAKEKSIASLRTHLAYPGPVSDIAFLIEQHVDYELRVQKLAESELDWMYTARDALYARTVAGHVTRVVIGDNSDRQFESLVEQMRHHLRHMTYPLREDKEIRQLDARARGEEDDGTSGGNSEEGGAAADVAADPPSKAARCKANCKNARGRTGSSMTKGTPATPPRATRKKRATQMQEQDFDAFVEVKQGSQAGNSPLVSWRKLDEVTVSARPQDDDEANVEGAGRSVLKKLFHNRFVVFIATCIFMFAYNRMS